MPKLYEIADELRQLLSTETEDGELPTGISDALDKVSLQFDEKAVSIGCFIRELLAEASAVEVEAKRLTALQQRHERKAAQLKEYLKGCMEAIGVQKIVGKLLSVRIQKNSRPSISVRDGAAVPESFRRVKVELDGAAAYEWWKAGNTMPPQLEVKEGNHLRVS